tara:strand:+ start:2096 stop:3130 length:1035 start_codon:yes stop_codon:yes gene_type:complete
MKKNLFVRVDVTPKIGTGHFFRCLTLTKNLINIFDEIIFITNTNDKNIIELILENEGYSIIPYESIDKLHLTINNSINWNKQSAKNFLLIDNYDLDWNFESSVRNIFNKIFVIDDLANRKHDCDLLIDQNYYHDQDIRYKKLLPESAQILIGPKYAIIRNEFKNVKKINFKNIKNILVSFGGSDPTNECEKILKAFSSKNSLNFNIIVIAGIFNNNYLKLKKEFQNTPNVKIFDYVKNIGQLMSDSDLFIGAGGTTTWERFYLGLPSITTIISDNQTESIEFLSKMGHVINLGFGKDVTSEKYLQTLQNLENNFLSDISKKNRSLVDGNGTDRIKQQIIELISD